MDREFLSHTYTMWELLDGYPKNTLHYDSREFGHFMTSKI